MLEGMYLRVVECLQELPEERAAKIIEDANDRIRATGKVAPAHDDVAMSALARRIYLFGLLAGIDRRDEGDGSGTATPQHAKVQDRMSDFATNILKLPGIVAIGKGYEKLVANFCTHKVSAKGSATPGFYVLAALFVLHEEARGDFKPDGHRSLVPESELRLGYDIGVFFARRLNEDATAAKAAPPFPEVRPAKPPSGHTKVAFQFLQHDAHAAQVQAFFDANSTPKGEDGKFGDDNAHLVLYRGRRSNPTELIKSFLVIKSVLVNPKDDRERHHPTIHFYKAPRKVGGTPRSAPGRVLPLAPGIFIVAGQHKAPSAQPGAGREAAEPFRALEMIFFPWENLQASSLFGGLALSINNDGEPLVGRVCARPTLLFRSGDARIGSVPLAELEADFERDHREELALKAGTANVDPDHILEIYSQFGSIADLAQRTAQLCNNNSVEGWGVAPGFLRTDGGRVSDADLESAAHEAFARFRRASGETLDFQQDLRIAPLVAI